MVPTQSNTMVESNWAEVIKDAVVGVLVLVFGAMIGAIATAVRKVSQQAMKEEFDEYDRLVIQPLKKEIEKLEENSKQYVRHQELTDRLQTVNEKIDNVKHVVDDLRGSIAPLPALMEDVRRLLRRTYPE